MKLFVEMFHIAYDTDSWIVRATKTSWYNVSLVYIFVSLAKTIVTRTRLRYVRVFAIANPSVVCLSVVCL